MGGGEAGSVDAVVDVVIDQRIDCVDLGTQLDRIEIKLGVAQASKALLSMRMISADSLLTMVSPMIKGVRMGLVVGNTLG